MQCNETTHPPIVTLNAAYFPFYEIETFLKIILIVTR
jgi:hypothetical protein